MIGFAGLSHLGIIYSTATAARGFLVMAFDPQPGVTRALAEGRLPVQEPGLETLLNKNRARIGYTQDAKLLSECELVFVALDVPTDEAGNSDLKPLEQLIETVAVHVPSEGTLVLMSQVPPGFSRKLASKLRSGLPLFYQVETLVFGNAVERAVHPERYIIGCHDPHSPRPEPYSRFLAAFDCPVLPMRYESAELCKIAINSFLLSSVTTSNTLAEICERIGADWYEIVPALRLDRRIGPHAYLSPGLGIAGGNLERDLSTVQHLAAEYGCDARVVTAWQQNSAYAREWVLRRLHRLGLLQNAAGSRLAVWGLAYKADTHSTKNSPALALLRSLPGYGWQVYDPAVVEDLDSLAVRRCTSALEALDGAAALIIMTPWAEFQEISPAEISKHLNGRTVVDPYRTLSGDAVRACGLDYHCLGAQT